MMRLKRTATFVVPCVLALFALVLFTPVTASSGPTVSGIVSAIQSGVWNVGITGTPSVTVANVPEVTIGGNPSVTVGNSAANPVLVRDIDRKIPARFNTYVGPGSTTDYPEVVPQVPAGQVLVITSVNISGFTPNPNPDLTDGACTLQLVSGGAGSFPMRVPLSVGFLGFATANVETYLAVNAGESVGVGCAGAPFHATTLYGVNLGGYYVPAQ